MLLDEWCHEDREEQARLGILERSQTLDVEAGDGDRSERKDVMSTVAVWLGSSRPASTVTCNA